MIYLGLNGFDRKAFEFMISNHPHKWVERINSWKDITNDQINIVKDVFIENGISCSVYDGILQMGAS